ncbi:uncharacterized protein LOC130448960 isoform X1 [Diorhabda sublineata]|uniref:uncharacterized protein LOC130448960 isoform X1 n=1 Tax=Diorhabda sublineata TaxID=1163346 RepID=UPI0024E10ACC|nr:uncharacterized protein LOC130448960 isoform X1 [Diorhabda sublineata]
MFFLKLCLSVRALVSLLVGLCQGYFQIITEDGDLQCKPSSIQCLSNNKSFVTCVNTNNLTILSTVLNCPDGYYCDDSTTTPCIADTANITTIESTTSTSSITTVPYTTQNTDTTPTFTVTTTDSTRLTTTISTTTEELSEATISTTKEETVTSSSDNTETTVSESTVSTVTSTNEFTTKKKVARPTGAPTCTSTGLYPAPACNQYYECVEKVFLLIFKYYVAELRTCIDGDYYDTGLQQCILAILSDCE